MSDSRRAVVLDWARGYPKEWLRPDLVAGLTAAAVVIPKAMAYATIAGLPLQVGLYTALVPMVVYAVLGTSRVAQRQHHDDDRDPDRGRAGPDRARRRPRDAAQGRRDADPAGRRHLVLASVLRLGFVANFISDPVLIGFKAGIGLVIVSTSSPSCSACTSTRAASSTTSAPRWRSFPHTSFPTLAVAWHPADAARRVERFFPRAPAPLVAVAAGDRRHRACSAAGAGRGTVGEVPRGLPTFVAARFELLAVLWPAAAWASR